MVEPTPLPDLAAKRILLVITGGIAAYKALELIRLMRKSGASVRAVLTKAGAEFVTALSVGALTEDKVYTDLWSLTDEAEKLWPHSCSVTALTLRVETPWTYISASALTKARSER